MASPGNLMVCPTKFDGFSQDMWWFFSWKFMVFSGKLMFSLRTKNLRNFDGQQRKSSPNDVWLICFRYVHVGELLQNSTRFDGFPKKNQFNWTQNRTKIVIKHQIWWFSPKETDKNHQRLGWMTTHLYSKQVRVMFRLSTINPMIFAMTSLP